MRRIIHTGVARYLDYVYFGGVPRRRVSRQEKTAACSLTVSAFRFMLFRVHRLFTDSETAHPISSLYLGGITVSFVCLTAGAF